MLPGRPPGVRGNADARPDEQAAQGYQYGIDRSPSHRFDLVRPRPAGPGSRLPPGIAQGDAMDVPALDASGTAAKRLCFAGSAGRRDDRSADALSPDRAA